VRLSAAVHDGDVVGGWHLEAAFGPCAANAPAFFATLECADGWFRGRLSQAA